MLQSSGTGPESKVPSPLTPGQLLMAMLLLTGKDRELPNQEMGGQGRSTQIPTLHADAALRQYCLCSTKAKVEGSSHGLLGLHF